MESGGLNDAIDNDDNDDGDSNISVHRMRCGFNTILHIRIPSTLYTNPTLTAILSITNIFFWSSLTLSLYISPRQSRLNTLLLLLLLNSLRNHFWYWPHLAHLSRRHLSVSHCLANQTYRPSLHPAPFFPRHSFYAR